MSCFLYVYDWCEDTYNDPYNPQQHELRYRAYGIDMEGKSTMASFRIYPYCYIELPTHIDWDAQKVEAIKTALVSKKSIKIQRITYSKKKLLYGYHKDPVPVLKVECWKKEHIRTIFNKLYHYKNKTPNPITVKSIGEIQLKLHEIVDPLLQYTVSNNLPMVGWIKATGSEPTERRTNCDNELSDCTLTYPKYQPKMIPEPLVLSFDIETYSSNPNAMPDPTKPSDVVILIGCVFNQHPKNVLLTLGTSTEHIEYDDVRYYETEKELLLGFSNLVQERKPKVITGYNIFQFDIPYMEDRIKYHYGDDMNEFKKWDCTGNSYNSTSIKWSSSAYGEQRFNVPKTEGIIMFDMYAFINREYTFSVKTLKHVSQYFLGETKDPLSIKDMFKLYDVWKSGHKRGMEAMSHIAKYCIQDAALVLKLWDLLGTWYQLTEMSSICQTMIGHLYTKGQQIRVFSSIYKYCTEKGIVVDNDTYHRHKFEHLLERTYQGAYVKDGKPGLYKQVASFDFCLTGDTLITMANGTSKRLDEMVDGDIVLGYKDGLFSSYPVKGGLQVKGKRSTVKIVFNDGSSLIATPDHKVLTTEGYIEASKLEGRTVISGPIYPYIQQHKQSWSLCGMDLHIDKVKLLTFVRVLGYILADGSIYNIKSKKVVAAEVYFGTQYDAELFRNDIQLLTGKTPTIGFRKRTGDGGLKGSIFRLAIPRSLVRQYTSLPGVIIGKRASQPMDLPHFLDTAPNCVLQAFLSGLYGGDGTAPFVIKKATNCSSVVFAWDTETSYGDAMKVCFDRLVSMHYKLGIDTEISSRCLKLPKMMTPSNGNQRIKYRLAIHRKYLIPFAKYISFSYCINKVCKLNVAASYALMGYHLRRQHKIVFDAVNRLFENGYGTIRECLVQGRLALTEKPLNALALSSLKDIYYQRGEITRIGSFRKMSLGYKSGFNTFKEYIHSTQTAEWFGDYSTNKYAVGREDRGIPPHYKTVLDVVDCGEYDVFDIEVSEAHNFIANGVVVHNCSLYPSLMIAYNIDYSTWVEDDAVVSDEDCNIIEWDDNEHHYRYRFKKEPIGVLPSIVQGMLDARRHTKQLMKAEKDPLQKRILDKRQLSYKVICNSAYGITGTKRGYLPFIIGASCITAMGRYNVKKAEAYLESKYNCTNIYSDSDSCYVIFNDPPVDIWKKCREMEREMVEDKVFPPAIKLEFENEIYTKFLFCKKKRYMYLQEGKDEIGKKGVLTKRRDSSKFTKRLFEMVVRSIFDGDNIDDVVYKVIQELNRLCARGYSTQYFVITTSIAASYKVVNISKMLYDKITSRDRTIDPGERVEYVFIKRREVGLKRRDVVEHLEYYKLHKDILQIDYLLYIDKGSNQIDELISNAYDVQGLIAQQYKWRMVKEEYLLELIRTVRCIPQSPPLVPVRI